MTGRVERRERPGTRSTVAVGLLAVLVAPGCDPGPPAFKRASAVRSEVALESPASVVADGRAAAVIVVTVRDENGKPLSGMEVRLASSVASDLVDQPPAPTDAAGRARGTVRGTVAGSRTVRVTVMPGSVVLESSVTWSFVGDGEAVSASRSSVAAAPVSAVADGSQQVAVTVTVRDVHGNPVAGRAVVLSASGSGSTITQPVPTGHDGVTRAVVTSTRAGTMTLTATVNPGSRAVVLADRPVVTFTGNPAEISSSLSTVTAAPGSGVVADGVATSTITVTVRDRNGAPVPGQTVRLDATGSANTLVQPGPTDAHGVTTGTIASTRAETKTITATVNPGPGQVVLAAAPAVTFVGDAANVSATLSSVTAAPVWGVAADGAALATVTVTVRDRHGNVASGVPVQLAASGSANTIVQPAPTGPGGVSAGTLASTIAEPKTITATANPGSGPIVLTARPQVTFVWTPPQTYYVRASGSDAADGRSPATAWRTLGRAAAAVGAGDTVWVGAGTYTGSVTFSASGTQANPIRLFADHTGAHTGDAGEVELDAASQAHALELAGSWIVVEGFTVRGAAGASAAGMRVTGDHVTLRDNVVWGCARGVYVEGATEWWDRSYPYRRKITFGTQHSLLPRGYTAAFTLDTRVASTNVALASGDDVRVVWQKPDGTHTELDRIGDAFNQASTRIEFRLASDVPAGAGEDPDGSYYVYYGYAGAGTPPDDEGKVYWFADFFDRPDSTVVGNGWTEWNQGGDVEIASNALVIKPTGDANPPQVGVWQNFPLGAIPGDFTVTLRWTMPGNDESIWSFWGVNLGAAASMTPSDRKAGVGVGLYNGESLGLSGTEVMSNDMSSALETGIHGTHTFRLVVKRATKTYDYWRDGVLRQSAVPFANPLSVLDAVRIGADNFGYKPGEEQTIDDYKIVLDVADGPEEVVGVEESLPAANGYAVLLEGNAISACSGPGDGVVLHNAGAAVVRDGAIYGNSGSGVVVSGSSASVLIAHCTLFANGSSQVRVDGSGNTVTVRDCVVAAGGAAGLELLAGSSTMTSDHNDVHGNTGGDWSGLSQGPNDLSADPGLVDPDGPDGVLGGAGRADDVLDLETSPPSPALDAGSTAATALSRGDGESFADRTTRTDDVLDGTSPDGATLNLGRHRRPVAPAPPALGSGDVRVAAGTGARRRFAHRTLASGAASWTALLRGPAAGATIRWVRAARVPTAAAEELVVVLSEAGGATELDVLRSDGAGWRREWTSSAVPAALVAWRGFDLVYERASGDALVVWTDGSANPRYRTRRRGVWSAEAEVFATPPGTGAVRWVRLAARPGSDEVALVYAASDGRLHAVVWDGASFDEAATETTLETALAWVDSQAFDVAYETLSGDLLVAWGYAGSGEKLRYATKAAGATTWTVQTLGGAKAEGWLVRLAADPGSDRITMAVSEGTQGDDVAGAIWTGATWSDVTEVDGKASSSDTDLVVAWAGSPGVAILIYRDKDGPGRLDWARWVSGAGWSLQPDVTLSGVGESAFGAAVRAAGTNDVVLGLSDTSGYLFGLRYDGVNWTFTQGGAALTPALSSTTTRAFDLWAR